MVRDGDLENGKSVEDVELGEVERRVPVDQVRVLEDDEVEPAAATTTTGRDAPLGSDFLQVNADGLFE